MIRHLSVACLVLVLLGISGGTTNARILRSREHRKFSQQGRDLEPDNIINARSPNGHIAGAFGVGVPPTHNGVTLHAGGVVVNVITSGEGSNVHVQEPGHAPQFSQVHSPAHSPAVIPFQSGPRTLVPVQTAGHAPSPIPFQLAAEPPGTALIQLSSTSAALSAPFAIPTTQVQQTGLAADACDCKCLCPFHFFGIPAVNLATSTNLGGVPSPTTFATVASPFVPGDSASSTPVAAPFFPPANGTVVSPDIPDIQTSSTTELPVAPIALPEPPEDSIITAGGASISSLGDAPTSGIEFVTPNEPAATEFVTPNEPAATEFVTPNEPAATEFVIPNDPAATEFVTPNEPAATEFIAPNNPAATEFVTPNEPAPAAPTETAATNADVTLPAETEADVTQPAGTEATATVTAGDFVATQEDPATVTDADFTQGETGNVDVIPTVTDAAAATDADSTQAGITGAPEETAAPEANPAVAESFDINTMTLHSALTLRLGG